MKKTNEKRMNECSGKWNGREKSDNEDENYRLNNEDIFH